MTLILADCLPELRKMKTKGVDLVLTDPPYGIGHGTSRGANSVFRFFNPKSWDNSIPSPADSLARIWRAVYANKPC